MSSNNEIVIVKKGKKFGVYENPCVDNEFSTLTSYLIGEKDSLEKAIKTAQKYMRENLVEYGISFEGI